MHTTELSLACESSSSILSRDKRRGITPNKPSVSQLVADVCTWVCIHEESEFCTLGRLYCALKMYTMLESTSYVQETAHLSIYSTEYDIQIARNAVSIHRSTSKTCTPSKPVLSNDFRQGEHTQAAIQSDPPYAIVINWNGKCVTSETL